MSRTVAGRRENFRQLRAGMARAVLRWHYVSRIGRSASVPAYTLTRDYEEQSVWKKSAGGWQERGMDMTRDTLTYRC